MLHVQELETKYFFEFENFVITLAHIDINIYLQ